MDALRTFARSTAFIVLPPTIIMGLTFPATAALLGDETGREGSDSGALLAVNTTGAIVATFVLPFFVIPLIGSPATLAALAVTNVAVGAFLLTRARSIGPCSGPSARSRRPASWSSSSVALLAWHCVRQPDDLAHRGEAGEVFEATEDEIAPVVAGQPQLPAAVGQRHVDDPDHRRHQADADPAADAPPRVEEGPRDRVRDGHGVPERAHAPASQADAVELVPSVPDMFHWYYADADQVLANPNGHVIVADGRNHVELTGDTYDFVVVDPPPPIESAGVSVISSLEFYQSAKARLNPDGVMVQWVPYGQTMDEFLAHVRTYLQVFPNVRVIAGAGGYGFYMIGSDGSVDLDPAMMAAALERPGVLEDLNSAPDSKQRSVDDWVQTLLGNTWASGDDASDGGRRRAADHRRPAAPRVLPLAPHRRPERATDVVACGRARAGAAGSASRFVAVSARSAPRVHQRARPATRRAVCTRLAIDPRVGSPRSCAS